MSEKFAELLIFSIFSRPGCVLSSPFLVLPSRSAIHTEFSFSSITSRMYLERRAELVSISRTVMSRSMTKQEFSFTRSVTQSLMSRLLPIAARVYLLPCCLRSTFSMAESRMMSRWLDMKMYAVSFRTNSMPVVDTPSVVV